MSTSKHPSTVYAVQIHTIKALESAGTISKNVFLDISSEGQYPRRYLMGNFADSDEVSLDSVVHYTHSAVTLSLDCGPLRYHTLGTSTIFRFLQSSSNEYPSKSDSEQELPAYEYLSFGRNGDEPSFQLSYSVRAVQSYYLFALNEVTCLKQITSWREDLLFAEIEFNHSLHAVDRGPRNRYRLGPFATHRVANIHSGFNLTFSTVSNFVMTLYAKSILKETIIGVIKFTPLPELFFNQQNQRSLAYSHNYHFSEAEGEPAAPIDWPTAQRGGLRMAHVNSTQSKIEITLADITKSTTARKKLMDNDSGGYEILFTITKGARLKEEILPKTLWKPIEYITKKDNNSDESTPTVSLLVADTDSATGTFGDDLAEIVPSQIVNQSDLIARDPAVISLVEKESHDRLSLPFKSVDFAKHTAGNYLEVLIDGLQTFRRYYEVLMEARHSISILGWELNLSFGLALEDQAGGSAIISKQRSPNNPNGNRRWITLEDVLIAKAKEGVKSRIIVWRHEILSFLNRYLFLGDVSVETEVSRFEKRCVKAGVSVAVLRTGRMPPPTAPEADPFGLVPSYDIVIIIAGSPRGLISSHHEKLVLIDPECPKHTVAFTGGFDIARGRYDQPAHKVPLPGKNKVKDAFSIFTSPFSKQQQQSKNKEDKKLNQESASNSSPSPNSSTSSKSIPNDSSSINSPDTTIFMPNSVSDERYSAPEISPIWRPLRLLWHDLQLLIRGPATRSLHLHFVQRWAYAFNPNPLETRRISLPSLTATEQAMSICNLHSHSQSFPSNHTNCILRIERTWKSVFDVNFLFDDYCRMIKLAEKFLYIEHQYPFQNFALTQHICEQLKSKRDLHLIVVTPIKTDLPTGIVGDLVDWSQDHIIQHLRLIHATAPDRVGIYGLVNQDPRFPENIKGIYVHSKLCLIDDLWMLTGSTNMDNISFFQSSELSIEIYSPQVAKETRIRLFMEHLGSHFTQEMTTDLIECFHGFKKAANLNVQSLKATGLLEARPFPLTPEDVFKLINDKIHYPDQFDNWLMRVGLSTEDVIQVVGDSVDNVMSLVSQKSKL